MDDLKVLMMQYEKLYASYELHHRRWDDHWKVYLIILSIFTAILSALFDKNGIDTIKFIVSIIGIIISISGCIALNRISNDASLTFYHLRNFENEFKTRGFINIPYFTIGKEFFEKGYCRDEKDFYKDLRFKPFSLRIIKITHLAWISFILFAIFFIVNLFL
jgi:hypothetical protein